MLDLFGLLSATRQPPLYCDWLSRLSLANHNIVWCTPERKSNGHNISILGLSYRAVILRSLLFKDWFQSFLIKGSKIFHWTDNHFSVFCFPWAKVWKNNNFLLIYHTNLFYLKLLQKCHQFSNSWFELFFYNSAHLQQLHFFLFWAEINPIFWKNAKFVNNTVNHLTAWQPTYFEK